MHIFFLIAFLFWVLIYESTPNTVPSLPSTPSTPILNQICLIGSTGSGKSSTGNALLGKNFFTVGAEHGSTTTAKTAQYANYALVDTPGLLDTVDYQDLVLGELLKSKIIVYVAKGQPYRQELDFIQKISILYLKENQTLILYINKNDEKEQSMSSADRAKLKAAIIESVAPYIEPDKIVFGASFPQKNGIAMPPTIETLKNLINRFV